MMAEQPARTQPKSNAPAQGQRLAKCVAELKACSRSDAERYIEGGWVSVNGQVVEEPQFRVTSQKIDIDANASLLALLPVTLLLHKPPGFDAMAPMEAGSRTLRPAVQLLGPATRAADDAPGTHVLKRHFTKLTATVPLETGAGGLVVYTQDWRVARKLTEDAGVMEQEIIVEVAGEVPPESLQRINHMQSADGRALPPVKVSVNSTGEKSSKLRFALKGVHLGLIAYLCERVGLEILSMKRLRIGRVSMTQLPIGQWRYLQDHERF